MPAMFGRVDALAVVVTNWVPMGILCRYGLVKNCCPSAVAKSAAVDVEPEGGGIVVVAELTMMA